jgi:hypothetical protein
MSSLGGSTSGGDEVPAEGEKGGVAPELSLPASRKRGRPKGSRNKKTLEVLTVRAATVPSTSVAPRATRALGDAPVKRGLGRPKGSGQKMAPTAAAAPSPSRHRGRPLGSKNKKAPAVLRIDASAPTGPRAATSPPLGPLRPWLEKPALQPPAYISAEGWSTYIIPALAVSRDLLCLPS